MRFRTLALVLALSVGATGLLQASKTTTVVGSERPKNAKKAKKTKPAKHVKTAKASNAKAHKTKPAKPAKG